MACRCADKLGDFFLEKERTDCATVCVVITRNSWKNDSGARGSPRVETEFIFHTLL